MQANQVERALEEVSRRWDLLKHPFYQSWSKGELTREELAYYAGQYAHVVRALPRWLEATAARDHRYGEELALHAIEEAAHIPLWEQFANALGIDRATLYNATPNPSTAALIAQCDELVDNGHGAAVVWSIENQSPAVSAEKLRGLQAYYGIGVDSGGRYFALHQELDKEHEAQLRQVISSLEPATRQAAPAAAERALEGMWNLLSSAQQGVAA